MSNSPELTQLVKELSNLDKSATKGRFAEIFRQIADLTKDYTESHCVIRDVQFPMLDLSELLNFEVDRLCGIKFIDCNLMWTNFDIGSLSNVEFNRCTLCSSMKDVLLNNVTISGKGKNDCADRIELELDNVRVVNSEIYGSRIHDAILCGTTISCI